MTLGKMILIFTLGLFLFAMGVQYGKMDDVGRELVRVRAECGVGIVKKRGDWTIREIRDHHHNNGRCESCPMNDTEMEYVDCPEIGKLTEKQLNEEIEIEEKENHRKTRIKSERYYRNESF